MKPAPPVIRTSSPIRGEPSEYDRCMLPSVSPERLREVAGAFVTGVTIVTTRAEDGLFGCTANAVASLSLEPPLMLVCLDRAANTHPRMLAASTFAINIIRAGDENVELCRSFAAKADDKFAGVPRTGSGRPAPRSSKRRSPPWNASWSGPTRAATTRSSSAGWWTRRSARASR